MPTKLAFRIGIVVLLTAIALRMPEVAGWANLNRGSLMLAKSVLHSDQTEQTWRDEGDAFEFLEQVRVRGILRGYCSIGRVMLWLGEYAAAQNMLTECVSIYPHDVLAYFWLAQALEFQGDMDDALAHYRQAGAGSYFRTRGMADAHSGNATRAQPSLLKAVVIDPADSVAWFELAQVYQAEGRAQDALYAYTRYLELPDRDYYRTHFARAYILRANRDWQGAEIEYQAAYQANPLSANPLKAWGNMLLYDVRDYAKAEQVLEMALEMEPENMWVYITLGDLYRIQGAYDLAERCYTLARQVNPSSNVPDSYLQLNAEQRTKRNDVK
jgi:tetratricopeptide (TPR) repeat protein